MDYKCFNNKSGNIEPLKNSDVGDVDLNFNDVGDVGGIVNVGAM